MSEKLECPNAGLLKVVGLTALNAAGNPARPHAQMCPHLKNVLETVRSKCDGHEMCQLKPRDIGVAKNQCPGVGSVNFRVRCVKPRENVFD